MIERLLGKVVVSVDAVHDLQGVVGVELVATILNPVHELAGGFGETNPHQSIERERGIADPGVAIVSVAFATDSLGQAAGRGGHDRTRRLERHQLERKRRPVRDLAPPALIGALPRHCHQYCAGLGHEFCGFLFCQQALAPAAVELPEDERR